MPLESINQVNGVLESNIPCPYLVPVSMEFVVVVMVICPVLVTMLPEIAVDCVDLAVDILSHYCKDCSQLCIRQ